MGEDFLFLLSLNFQIKTGFVGQYKNVSVDFLMFRIFIFMSLCHFNVLFSSLHRFNFPINLSIHFFFFLQLHITSLPMVITLRFPIPSSATTPPGVNGALVGGPNAWHDWISIDQTRQTWVEQLLSFTNHRDRFYLWLLTRVNLILKQSK